MTVTIRVAPLPHFEGLQLPAYETADAAGMDLRAAVPDGEPMTLKPGERAMVPTGLTIALPPRHEAQVRPRSGLAAKHGVHHTMIASWKRQAIDGMAGTFSGAGDAAKAISESEVEKLHAKIGQLVVERDFLAKAFGR